MTSVDPSTGQPLPTDAIQRILFVSSSVHVYSIPPLTSNKGYNASLWTADNNKRQIFTARLRILETAAPTPNGAGETVKTDVLLEDRSSGQLFAAAPYTSPAAVEQVLDSSRFFAVRVVGDGGMKAVLGIGFEERSEAFDFSITLQEVRKVQGMDKDATPAGARKTLGKGIVEEKIPDKTDFSLKEGQIITVNIGGRGRRQKEKSDGAVPPPYDQDRPFSVAPPSTSGGGVKATPFLPPPPNTQHLKAENRRSRQSFAPEPATAANLGFDDGEFGEFQ
ncbi:MAG: hypothetical protein M1830_001979 [Pleopsidium flavum]|nr:MAG: hypothetical protein M1830_001979 [Pleopsidium flavum]